MLEERISEKWIISGATSAKSDQHTVFMQSTCTGRYFYSTTEQALSKVPEDETMELRIKLDITHFAATDQLSLLTKYIGLCELEAQHEAVPT